MNLLQGIYMRKRKTCLRPQKSTSGCISKWKRDPSNLHRRSKMIAYYQSKLSKQALPTKSNTDKTEAEEAASIQEAMAKRCQVRSAVGQQGLRRQKGVTNSWLCQRMALKQDLCFHTWEAEMTRPTRAVFDGLKMLPVTCLARFHSVIVPSPFLHGESSSCMLLKQSPVWNRQAGTPAAQGLWRGAWLWPVRTYLGMDSGPPFF